MTAENARPRRRSRGPVVAGAALCLVVTSAACSGERDRSSDRTARESTAEQRFGWIVRDGDEFAGTALDLDRWRVYNGPGTDNVGARLPSAVEVKDGSLVITGRGDVSGGIAWRAGGAITHGRWEFRARSDKGNGYSPVILLWPDSDRWPQDGEIDIMEVPSGDRSSSSLSLHWGPDDQQEVQAFPGDFSQWHVFALDWQDDYVTLFIDGVEQYTTRTPDAIPTGPMHLAIQNDVGPIGNWVPPRDASTPAKVSLYVDWVRIYY